MSRPTEVVWFGLQDCEGLCDCCKKQRKLVAQYKPNDDWLCVDCFRTNYQERLAS